MTAPHFKMLFWKTVKTQSCSWWKPLPQMVWPIKHTGGQSCLVQCLKLTSWGLVRSKSMLSAISPLFLIAKTMRNILSVYFTKRCSSQHCYLSKGMTREVPFVSPAISVLKESAIVHLGTAVEAGLGLPESTCLRPLSNPSLCPSEFKTEDSTTGNELCAGTVTHSYTVIHSIMSVACIFLFYLVHYSCMCSIWLVCVISKFSFAYKVEVQK